MLNGCSNGEIQLRNFRHIFCLVRLKYFAEVVEDDGISLCEVQTDLGEGKWGQRSHSQRNIVQALSEGKSRTDLQEETVT